MGLLKLAGQTAVMILTGKVVSEGFDKAKKKVVKMRELNKAIHQPEEQVETTAEQVEV